MHKWIACFFAVTTLAAVGCHTDMRAAYWMPNFDNKTQSGSGSDTVDIKQDFGVETDSGVLAFDLTGEAGSHRVHFSYWKITGEGTATITDPAGIDFADHTYAFNDDTSTTLDLTTIGAFYEPAIVRSHKFATRLLIGVNLINFNIIADDITNPPAPGDGEVHVPEDGDDADLLGIGYMPVPLVGLVIEATIKPWVSLYASAQFFDTEFLPVGDFDASFMGGEAGLLLGKARSHVQGFVGYRYLHTEYTYDDTAGDPSSGDSTLDGIVGSVVVRF